MAERQLAFLDEAAAKAPSPFAAMTYNWPRAEVYVYLDRAKELVPALEKSVADLPNEYDPPYRLAWLHYKLGAFDKALPLAQTAIERAYGPHKARILSLIADIHKAQGDVAAEREARKAVLAVYESLPEGQRQPLALRRAFETLMSVDDGATKSDAGPSGDPPGAQSKSRRDSRKSEQSAPGKRGGPAGARPTPDQPADKQLERSKQEREEER